MRDDPPRWTLRGTVGRRSSRTARRQPVTRAPVAPHQAEAPQPPAAEPHGERPDVRKPAEPVGHRRGRGDEHQRPRVRRDDLPEVAAQGPSRRRWSDRAAATADRPPPPQDPTSVPGTVIASGIVFSSASISEATSISQIKQHVDGELDVEHRHPRERHGPGRRRRQQAPAGRFPTSRATPGRTRRAARPAAAGSRSPSRAAPPRVAARASRRSAPDRSSVAGASSDRDRGGTRG